MKTKILLLIPFILLSACSPNEETRTVQRERQVCDESTVQAREAMFSNCLTNAPQTDAKHADDVIRACGIQAKDLYCPKKTVSIVQRCVPFFWLCQWEEIHIAHDQLTPQTKTNNQW